MKRSIFGPSWTVPTSRLCSHEIEALPSRPESEQGLKRGHRHLAPVMATDEFVELDLQVMPADTVIGADEPLLQVTDRAVRKRDHGRHTFAEGAPDGLRGARASRRVQRN